MNFKIPVNPPYGWITGLFHFITTIVGFFYIEQTQFADANKYWFKTLDAEKFIETGFLPFRENLLYYFNYFPAVILELPFWAGFLIYSLIGLTGFYILLSFKIVENSGFYLPEYLFLFVLLLPNTHFWTSIIGKEAVCFLAIALILRAVFRNKLKTTAFFVGFLLLSLVRPHIAAILAVSISAGHVLSGKKLPVTFFLLMAVFVSLLTLILLKSHWIGNLSYESITHMFRVHHEVLKSTDTYVPLENYNEFYKIITFYFRPFPGEIQTFQGLLLGIENLVTAIIALTGFICLTVLITRHRYRLNRFEWSVLIFSVLLGLILSQAYSNFGLIARMKIQSEPFLLILFYQWITLYFQNRSHAKA